MANLKNTQINDTGFLQIPTGSGAQRPSIPTNGEIRYNSELKYVEQYDVEYDLWFPINFLPPVATGGSVNNITIDGVNYRVHTFTTVGTSTFTVTRSGEVEYLIVAGGGGGGSAAAGGGGGGGFVTGKIYLDVQSYNVVVGAGAGPGPRFPMGTGGIRYQPFPGGIRGDNSSAFGLVAIGGGNGGGDDSFGCDGGSGGGGADDSNFAGPGESVQNVVGAAGFGNRGGDGRLGGNGEAGAGGGGAGEEGFTNSGIVGVSQQRKGGDGLVSFIDGTPKFYAGGGGGSMKSSGSTGTPGKGGLGGGGNGASPNGFGGAGSPNTGGGGGGNSTGTQANNGGGSGIVIVRYRIS